MVRVTGALTLAPSRPRSSYWPAAGAVPAARPAVHLFACLPFQVTLYSRPSFGGNETTSEPLNVLHVSEDQTRLALDFLLTGHRILHT